MTKSEMGSMGSKKETKIFKRRDAIDFDDTDEQSDVSLNYVKVKVEPQLKEENYPKRRRQSEDKHKQTHKKIPNVVQNHNTITATCSNGMSVRIEDDRIQISTASDERVTLTKDFTTITSKGCTVDVKDGVVRLQGDHMDSLFNFT